jgi:hypothetical protein
MKEQTIEALAALGAEISEVKYKYQSFTDFGFDDTPATKFVIKGSFRDESDIHELLKEIIVMRAILKNKHPAIRDLYNQLQTIAGITK